MHIWPTSAHIEWDIATCLHKYLSLLVLLQWSTRILTTVHGQVCVNMTKKEKYIYLEREIFQKKAFLIAFFHLSKMYHDPLSWKSLTFRSKILCILCFTRLKKMLIGQTESSFEPRRKSDSKCILHSSFLRIKMQKIVLQSLFSSSPSSCVLFERAIAMHGARLAFAVHSAAKWD